MGTLIKNNKPIAGDTDRVIYDAKHDCHEKGPGAFLPKNKQIFAEDKCDSSITTDSVTMSWGPREFNCRSLGDYVRTYTVVDPTIPTIEVMGGDETLEASRDVEYTDKGATCSDVIDGELSHAVEVSGEVVNMRIPGTYAIQYDCQDLSGNEAVAEKRTVVVQDTQKPVLTLLGAKINYVEAGFPYIDAGATATDSP